jgi:hypothetical protein
VSRLNMQHVERLKYLLTLVRKETEGDTVRFIMHQRTQDELAELFGMAFEDIANARIGSIRYSSGRDKRGIFERVEDWVFGAW